MNSYVDSCLKNFVTNRTDLFDGTCSYSHFVPNDLSETASAGGGHNSNILTGRIAYRRQRDRDDRLFQSSNAFALKLKPTHHKHYFVPVAFFNEIQFFTTVLPVLHEYDAQIAALFAKYYAGDISLSSATNYDAVVVLDDLRASDYRDPIGSRVFLDYEYLSLMARKLAAFHAVTYRLKRNDELKVRSMGDLFSSVSYTLDDNVRSLHTFCVTRGFHALRADPKYGVKIARIESTLADCEESIRSWFNDEKGYRFATLCHGDYLAHNTMAKYDERGRPIDLKIIDMASCTLASPLIDLALLFYYHMDQRTRDQYWDALLDEYCESLRQVYSKDGYDGDNEILPSKNDLMDEFRTKSLYAYTIAAFYLPWQFAIERQMPSPFELMPERYRIDCNLREIPPDVREKAFQIVGGNEATAALVDILKDIIDRGFV